MNNIGGKLDGDWFCEAEGLWGGRSACLKVDEPLFEGQSKFQRLRVFRNSSAGVVLTLDDIIQVTERDEMAYHEMLAHVPLFAHPDPKRVLVVGGGDGGTVREVARHAGVERIDLCEIDERVIEVARRFMPFTACGLDDPRVNVVVADGAKWVAEHRGEYDAILVDSSDPIGPAEVLYQAPFYRDLRAALRPGGIVATQAECLWLHSEIIEELMDMAAGVFDVVSYCWTSVPTYPAGTIGFLIATLGPRPERPLREPDADLRTALRYYTPELHAAAFQLPAFARRLAR